MLFYTSKPIGYNWKPASWTTGSKIECLTASTRHPCWWWPTDCNWTPPKLKSYGAHKRDVNIKSRSDQFGSATLQCFQYRKSATSGSTWTRTSPWQHMSLRPCFSVLRQIRSVRRSLPRHALLTLIRALVVSKVDYCNSLLAGAPGRLLDQLQSVLNVAARLIFSARKREHIAPLFHELHWLRVPRGLNSGYVFWRVDVFTARRHHTSLSLFT